ncbi:carboxymuconolactone decarboxylase family protein [Rhodanobacter lindaniclasticus]
MAAALACGSAAAQSHDAKESGNMTAPNTTPAADTLGAQQQAILPIAAFAAAGDMDKLSSALNQGLDAGLSISDAREVLVQLYAYAGFPRSLNALAELMKVVDARKQRGIHDASGREPGHAIPTGDALLAAGRANQTRLAGAPVQGPLFDFAPVINRFLQTHLFGDIFERDNLDWQSRELATVGALAALPGLESQLASHIRISVNVGLTPTQLQQAADVLSAHGDADAARRVREALDKYQTPATR